MTNEEMEKRWPELPPNEAEMVTFYGDHKRARFKINQDTIDEVILYLQCVKESMNE